MTDLVVLIVGTSVSFTFLAGCYIYIKENMEPVEIEVESTGHIDKDQSIGPRSGAGK